MSSNMGDSQNPKSSPQNQNLSSPSPKIPIPVKNGKTHAASSTEKVRFPNPPDLSNPDPATLREQWRFAIKQYSRWYSHAWGTAILAGLSFFALGWIVKGSNPLPSYKKDDSSSSSPPNDAKEAHG